MIFLIKGMVCDRCIYVLKHELVSMKYEVVSVKLGCAIIKEGANLSIDIEVIKSMLKKNGFDLIYDKNQKIINRIKQIVEVGIETQIDTGLPTRFAEIISNDINKNYYALSALFSTIEGITIEKYTIYQKIEKVKELLIYTDMSLTQISHVMGYSSQACLSNQLKKHTGLTSSHFKQIKRDKGIIYTT